VRSGREVTITDRGRPVARLVPVTPRRSWRTIRAFATPPRRRACSSRPRPG